MSRSAAWQKPVSPCFPRMSGDELGSLVGFGMGPKLSRMSGDEPGWVREADNVERFSPHEQG